MEERKILVNILMAPDGTIVPSFTRHDYRTHICEDGQVCSNDGGTDYWHRSGRYTDMTIYEDDSFEVIRRFFCRGGRGKDGKQPLRWVPLYKMSTEWLKACLEYNPNNYYNKYYKEELRYRSLVSLFKIKTRKKAPVPQEDRYPSNQVISVGYKLDEPKVGEVFYLYSQGGRKEFRTSTVTKIIDSQTFKTRNSIYRIISRK